MIKILPLKTISVCVVFFTTSLAFGQGAWKQTGSNINGVHAGDNFGTTIHFAANGNTFAAAAVNDSTNGSLRGQVRVFTRSGNSWVQKGANLTGVANGDFFGRSVALDSVGNTIAIGGPYNDAGLGSMSTAGHVKVYSWSGSAWTQKGSTLLADSAGENFGYSVSISYDGNTLAIGIPFGRDTLNVYRGRVKIYRWNGTAWNQLGKSLIGLNKDDVFGNAVSLDRTGNTVAIGAPFHSAGGPEAGRVSVYNWNNTDTSWHQLGSGIDGDTSDYSGTALSLSADGKRLAVGSPQDIIFGGYGVARMYEWNNTAWVQMGSSVFSPYFADQFGNAISISGDGSMVAVGASVNVTGSEAGRTQVYKWTGSAWALAGDTIKGVTSGDGAGSAVSLSYNGKLLATGAPMAGGNGANSGITTVMSYCTHNSSTVNITSCSGNYVSPSGKYTWTTGGTYKDTIANNGGCDSVITINLTIGTKPTVNLGADISTCTSTMLDAGNQGSTFLWNNNDTTRTLTVSTSGTYFVKVTNNGCFAYDTITVTITILDTAVSLSGTVLTAAQNGASYQWLDCKNGLQAVTGGVNKTLNLIGCAGDTYSYAVEITKNGCKDTSSCQTGSLSWFQKGNDVAGEVAGDKAGWAVSLSADGKTMAVGARDNDGNGTDAGHVRIFTWNGTAWMQKGADIDGSIAGGLSGFAVSLSANGETVAVGSPGTDDSYGSVRALTWNGSAWEIKGGATFSGGNKKDLLGYAVSLSADGNTLAMGSAVGKVWIEKWNGAEWKTLASINGIGNPTTFGKSLSLSADGKTLAVGDPAHSGGANSDILYAGHVRIFKLNGTTWVQMGGEIEGENEYDQSGYGVSLSADGQTVSIGTPLDVTSKGLCKVFSWNGTAWVQKGSTLTGVNPNDRFGTSTSLSADGNMLAVGAPTDGSGSGTGYCKVFLWNGSTWVQNGANLFGDSMNSRHGYSVSLSADGSTLAAGAPENTAKGGVVKTYMKCNNTSPVGIKEENLIAGAKNSITVYPNPSTGLFTLQSNGSERLSAVEVFNTMGQLVYSNTFTGNTTETALALHTQPTGIYFVKVTTTAGAQTLRLMVQH